MRLLIALLVIIYLVGVGVVLAPTIEANWSTASRRNSSGVLQRNCRERCLGRRRYIAALQSAVKRSRVEASIARDGRN